MTYICNHCFKINCNNNLTNFCYYCGGNNILKCEGYPNLSEIKNDNEKYGIFYGDRVLTLKNTTTNIERFERIKINYINKFKELLDEKNFENCPEAIKIRMKKINKLINKVTIGLQTLLKKNGNEYTWLGINLDNILKNNGKKIIHIKFNKYSTMKSKLEAKDKFYDFLNLKGIQLYVISGVSEEKISFSI